MYTCRIFTVVLMLCVSVSFGANAFAPWEDLGGGPRGINDAGLIVGSAKINNLLGAFHGYILVNGTMQDLGVLGGGTSTANAVNSAGQVVGQSETAASTVGNNVYHAFLWQNSKMTDLGTLGGAYSSALDINDQGTIVGVAYTANGEPRAVRWLNLKIEDLGTLGGDWSEAWAVNGAGTIVGRSATTNNEAVHAFLWQNGVMVDLGTLGGSSEAYDINDAGQVVGLSFVYKDNIPEIVHAVLWDKGSLIDLGTLGGSWSRATAINNAGQIVGASGTATGQPQAFLFDNGSLAPLPNIDNATGSFAWSINGTGQIAGSATLNVSTCYTEKHVVLWQNSTATDLTPSGPTGNFTVPDSAKQCNNSACGSSGLALIAVLGLGFGFLRCTPQYPRRDTNRRLFSTLSRLYVFLLP
jgi:probable HAF family extracellular repeat protein